MAAPLSEGLFSLELLVDWVRLEAGPPPPVVAVREGQEPAEEEEGTSPPRLSRPLCPAVAFRLLDFPTLLVYPPGGRGGPAPEPRPGLVSFGRGKFCLFRMHPATLRRRLLGTPLHTWVLQLPPGLPTPAPQLLGSCSVSLAAAAHKVLGPAASGCSDGQRGSFPLHNQAGERMGDIALGYRLTDLGSSLLGRRGRPVTSTGGGVEGVDVREAVKVGCQGPRENPLQQPNSQPRPRDADKPLVGFKVPKAQEDLKETVFHSKANSRSVENGKTNSVCSNASSVGHVSPPDQEVTDLDIDTNVFCPPPLYYTHLIQEKTPPAQRKITIEPLMNVPEQLDDTFPEEKLVNTLRHASPLKRTNSVTRESPPVLINPPHVQDIETSHQSTCHPEQNKINTIRQLPLLNALLVELSLLNNQPLTSPTHIHPHLAWLYRTEDKNSPDSSAKCTCKSECKNDKLPVEKSEKSSSLQYKKNHVEIKKGKHLEKNGASCQKRVPRGKLLYGLTNTLRLRLMKTNPDMLVVHEEREQYRKMQAQMGSKFRIPSSKVKGLSCAEQHQKPHQLPKDKNLESDASFAENSDTWKQISEVFGDLSTTKETKLKCATEKTVDYGENRTNDGSLKEIVRPANSIIPEGFTHTSILEGKVEMKVQSPFVFQQVTVDRIVVDKQMGDRQLETTDHGILTADVSENRPSENSCSESISELKYSDDFTSPCYSEDFCTTEDTSKLLQAHDRCPGAENTKHSPSTSKSCEARLSLRKNSSEKSSIPTPPFSAGSPIYSYRRSHISKTQDSLEEASTISTSDISSYWTEEKENQADQNSMHHSEVTKRGQDISLEHRTRRPGFKSSGKSQSPHTSQMSSYLPHNWSEVERNVLGCSTSDHFGEVSDEVGSLNISKQCKDICELVINKLPGYTM